MSPVTSLPETPASDVRVASDLPAASLDHADWLVTPTTSAFHQPPPAPSRMWLCAGSGTSASAVGDAPRAPAMRDRSTSIGWFGQLAGAHIGDGDGFAKSGTST